jgi:hypothetical protein
LLGVLYAALGAFTIHEELRSVGQYVGADRVEDFDRRANRVDFRFQIRGRYIAKLGQPSAVCTGSYLTASVRIHSNFHLS